MLAPEFANDPLIEGTKGRKVPESEGATSRTKYDFCEIMQISANSNQNEARDKTMVSNYTHSDVDPILQTADISRKTADI